jgi:hypothetical protein
LTPPTAKTNINLEKLRKRMAAGSSSQDGRASNCRSLGFEFRALRPKKVTQKLLILKDTRKKHFI